MFAAFKPMFTYCPRELRLYGRARVLVRAYLLLQRTCLWVQAHAMHSRTWEVHDIVGRPQPEGRIERDEGLWGFAGSRAE